MTHSQRTIHLRRPPVLAMQEGVFVPRVDASVLDEVERRWRSFCDAKPGAFDGRVCHVLGVHRNGHGGATIHAVDCAYRYFAVQEEGFDLGVRPLGVKGIVVRGESVLVGRRAAGVAWYPGMREFAPGGVVEPGSDPEEALERELAEETGLRMAGPASAIAILYDAAIRTWEVVYRLQGAGDRSASTAEYDSLEWILIEGISMLDDLSPVSRSMVRFLAAASAAEQGSGRQPG